MSHSNGAGSVSSKSLISKTGKPSGEAKVPKFAIWQSPPAWTHSPVIGVSARSVAMTAVAPRKKAKGEARMRSYRMGSRLAIRCRPDSTRISTGSRRATEGAQCACALRGTILRSAWPACRRSITGRTFTVCICSRGMRAFPEGFSISHPKEIKPQV